MKIAVVLDQYFTHDGGAFTFQGELLNALVECVETAPHEFVVFSPAPLEFSTQSRISWQLYRKPSLFERALLKTFRFLPVIEDWLAWQSSLEKQIRRSGVNLAWFLSPRLRGLRLPYIPLVLDLQHRLQPQFPEVSARGEWRLRESHYGRWLPRARAIVTGTLAGLDELRRFYQIPEQRVICLPHPTPQAALGSQPAQDAAVLERLGLKAGYLLYPAQLWTHKNHKNLLQALAILKEDGFRMKLVLTGADYGAGASIQKQIEELGLQTQVTQLGFVSQQDLYALYRNAMALTYLSFFGPENLPPLEAFALGCPVIAARVSGAEEQLAEAALLVNPTDAHEIASAIRLVNDDPVLRQRLIQAGHMRAVSWTTKDFVLGAIHAFDEIERGEL